MMENILWRIEMFGGLKARRGQRVIARFESRKSGALLAFLALHPQRTHPRESLAELLWPDEDWSVVRSRLRQTLSLLRHELEPPGTPPNNILIADRNDIRVAPNAITTDVGEFEAALRSAARTNAPHDQAAYLQQAVALYQGDLLPGYYEEEFQSEGQRLAEAFRKTLRLLTRALEESGDLEGAIEVARRAVGQDPLLEDAQSDLMRLYAASGRLADALRQYRELEKILREALGVTPSAATRNLLAQLRADTSAPIPTAHSMAGVQKQESARVVLESEGGAVPLHSLFYVVRPTDAEFQTAITRQDSIVLVKGGRQTGKTSLLARGLQQAREAGARVVLTDFQKLTPEQLESAATLFHALADRIADQLDLDVDMEAIWNPRRGWNVNFERFLRREVLAHLDVPLVWGMDEIDHLFHCPYRQVAFSLFRSWHNERSLDPNGPWGKLTLAMAYATEAHLFITDLNQSPFNVGTRLTLEDFTPGEVGGLNLRYGAPLCNEKEIARYVRMVGGNPYLVRRGLHAMVDQGMDITALEAQAGNTEGVFSDFLRRLLVSITQDADLTEALRTLLRGQRCLDTDSFYRLRSAGAVVGKSSQDAQLRCGLYRQYLENALL